MAKGIAQDLFRSKAPWIMALLMRDFRLQLDDVAAIVGNLGHESGGFASLHSPPLKLSLEPIDHEGVRCK